MTKNIFLLTLLASTTVFAQDTLTVLLNTKSLLKTDLDYSLVVKQNPSIQYFDIISGKVEFGKCRFTIGLYNSNLNNSYSDLEDKFLIGLYNENELYISKNADVVKEKNNIFRVDALLFEITEINSLKKYCKLTIKENDTSTTKIDIITRLPILTLKSSTAKEITSKNLLEDGKPCLFIFWADWCNNSITELFKIESLYNEFKNKINFIGINGDSDKDLPLSKLIDKYKLQWVQVYNDIQIMEAFKEKDIYPTSLLFDEKGYLISNYVKYETVRQYFNLVK